MPVPPWGGGSALTQFNNDWHPADPNADPYNPNTVWVPGYYAYTGTTANTSSLFNFQSAAYVRLKSAEIGYNTCLGTYTGHALEGLANGNVLIGSDASGQYFDGNIDDIRIYYREVFEWTSMK